MSEQIVVFGAMGNLGSRICLYLKSKNYGVVAVGHRKSNNDFFKDNGIPYYSVNIESKEDFHCLPQKDIFAVLHFAGMLPASMSGYDPNAYITSIVNGTQNVLDYCIKSGAKKIIFPQTLFDVSYLFGSKVPIPADSLRKAPLDGDHAMYVICKNAAVDMIEHYYVTKGLHRFILRLPRIYMYSPNPYTFTNGEKNIISDRLLIQKAINGENLELWGDPYRLLETCSVYDFLHIIKLCVDSELDGGLYNVGSGGSTLKERIEGIAEIFGNERTKIILKPEKPNGTQFVLDIRKTIFELGYEPKYSWKKYLVEFKKEMNSYPFQKLHKMY